MKLSKAVQIAVEAICLQRFNISLDARMFKIYHSDNARNRACAELYDRYTEAIELLNSLVTNSDPAVYRSITNELGTEPDQHQVDPGFTPASQGTSHQSDIDRDIERRR